MSDREESKRKKISNQKREINKLLQSQGDLLRYVIKKLNKYESASGSPLHVDIRCYGDETELSDNGRKIRKHDDVLLNYEQLVMYTHSFEQDISQRLDAVVDFTKRKTTGVPALLKPVLYTEKFATYAVEVIKGMELPADQLALIEKGIMSPMVAKSILHRDAEAVRNGKTIQVTDENGKTRELKADLVITPTMKSKIPAFVKQFGKTAYKYRDLASFAYIPLVPKASIPETTATKLANQATIDLAIQTFRDHFGKKDDEETEIVYEEEEVEEEEDIVADEE